MNWGNIWSDICNYFRTNVWNIVWFFAILVIGIIVIKVLMACTRKILGGTKMEKIAQQFICTILKFVLWLVLILLLLSQLGVEVTGILTAFSAVLLAVGMALQNAIANVANGIIIISSHMFKKGDYIITGGVEGSINDINFMFTTLITPDNKKITMPNSNLLNNNVTNLGAFPKRRVDFTFSVAYESDVEQVKKIVVDVMKSNGKVYLNPEPFCRLKVLNSSSIDFFSNCWCDNEDYWDVYYYIIENVYNEFKRNNISVPYNQLEVRERKDDVVMPVLGKTLPKRVEKERKVDENFEEKITRILSIKHKDKKNQKSKIEESTKSIENSNEEQKQKQQNASEENSNTQKPKKTKAKKEKSKDK